MPPSAARREPGPNEPYLCRALQLPWPTSCSRSEPEHSPVAPQVQPPAVARERVSFLEPVGMAMTPGMDIAARWIEGLRARDRGTSPAARNILSSGSMRAGRVAAPSNPQRGLKSFHRSSIACSLTPYCGERSSSTTELLYFVVDKRRPRVGPRCRSYCGRRYDAQFSLYVLTVGASERHWP
jgi:hypothetical protein